MDIYYNKQNDPSKRTANHVICVCRMLKKLGMFEDKEIHLLKGNVLEGVKRWKLNLFQSMSINEKLNRTMDGIERDPIKK